MENSSPEGRGPGRPKAERAACGRPARVRLTYGQHQNPEVEKQDLFASPEVALRLVISWARNDCMPPGLKAELRGVKGWGPL